jgi:probable rRNA maturation factor
MTQGDAYVVLVGGPSATDHWAAIAEDVLPLALARLAGRGEAPGRGEVSVTLVDDEAIRELNRDYRGIDAPTDVLSFSQLEGTPIPAGALPPDYPVPIGDIVVSIPRMRRQAVDYGHSEERELGFLLVHGLLHLLGYDHEDSWDARVMRAAEEDILASACLTREPKPGPNRPI